MKRSTLVGLVACAGLAMAASLGVSSVLAQPSTKDVKKEAEKLVQPKKDAKPEAAKPTDAAKPATATPPDEKAMEAAWMKLMEKNEHHERFKGMEGSWDAVVKHWMDPSQPPQESKGVMVNTLIHDGRFVHHEFKGDFMGMPFTGMGSFGYNNANKRYEGTWTDNMGTGTLFMTGTYDEKAKTYTTMGEMDMGPEIGKVKMRDVVQIVDADHHVQTMYQTMPGMPGEAKAMEITYTRQGTKKAEGANAIDATKADAEKKLKEAADKLKKEIGK